MQYGICVCDAEAGTNVREKGPLSGVKVLDLSRYAMTSCDIKHDRPHGLFTCISLFTNAVIVKLPQYYVLNLKSVDCGDLYAKKFVSD